jgi:peptidoglycan-associated lipoprotein
MMNQGISAGLGDVYFEFDQSLLRPKDLKVLDENVRWLKANSARKVTIQGHADERGTNEYNLTLGERRAQAAKRYLLSQGIEPHRIRTISYGEENPFCKDRNEGCFQQNRRGRFVKLN